MKHHRLSVSIVLSLILAPLASAQDALIAKQLAGSPDEFVQMQPADPLLSAIHSKSALLPVSLSANKSGGYSWQGEFPAEATNARFIVFSGGQSDWNVELSDPNSGRSSSARSLASDNRQAQFGLEQASHPGEYFAFEGIETGVWSLNINSNGGAQRSGFVLLEGESNTQLVSYQSKFNQRVGQRIGFVATLSEQHGANVALGAEAGRVERASLRVTSPNGQVSTLGMFDDGRHNDGLANDGTFGGDFFAREAGQYQAQVSVRGTNSAGVMVLRTAEHLVPVVENSLQVAASGARMQASSDAARLAIRVPVASTKAGQHYRSYAELWGTDRNGQPVAVAWVGGMVTPNAGAVDLAVDTRWIAQASARAPFELRNLRLEDPNHFVTVADARSIALSYNGAPITGSKTSFAVDEAMRMGVRPSQVAAKGVGRRLLLVHGYCSGGVWPAAQFATSSTFLDTNQSRSHDQFARLIQTFGNTWNSFGVVAHSQGGAASLHLLTYYWSGLDNAVGARMIQSVGTPYQGTNLAGILATLGGWFGVGCSSNTDLSYSGASSWLAGIPTWARAKVNFHTTSFRTTNWWTNDYCNFATDLVLSDPEDGTTEQAKGQLPSAINRGHVTGQCHTAGMRDPAQYQDAGRNATMNAEAAR